MRWFFVLIVMLNGVFYLAHKSERGFDVLSERLDLASSNGNIELLAERGGEAVEQPPRDLVPAPSASEEACLVLGPYSGEADFGSDRTGLPGLRVYLEEYERGADYWVYLGPYSSLAVATKMGGELRAKRIDNFVIRKGELKDAISLGVFTDAERAATHAKGLSKKNYEAKIRRIAKLANRYWLVFRGERGGDEYSRTESVMAKLQDNNKKLGEKDCNLIASYKQFD
ncbi:SPOR domain-containing protein [Zhongshania aliphaticivorans]|uniref:SPOR domain-containing protein n=1 Tax=Zhongshania aliphaticivorans TaxID=1470434 RepID=UPI0039C9069A